MQPRSPPVDDGEAELIITGWCWVHVFSVKQADARKPPLWIYSPILATDANLHRCWCEEFLMSGVCVVNLPVPGVCRPEAAWHCVNVATNSHYRFAFLLPNIRTDGWNHSAFRGTLCWIIYLLPCSDPSLSAPFILFIHASLARPSFKIPPDFLTLLRRFELPSSRHPFIQTSALESSFSLASLPLFYPFTFIYLFSSCLHPPHSSDELLPEIVPLKLWNTSKQVAIKKCQGLFFFFIIALNHHFRCWNDSFLIFL